MILLSSLLVLVGLSGCVSLRPIVLYPIDKQDIVIMKKDSSYTPDRDGYFISKFYMKEVMETRVN